jgi:endonuclease-3 related protein
VKFAKLVQDQFGGSVSQMFSLDSENLRRTLRSVNGIGRELADAILLYAANRPVFVASAAAARILKRHGWVDLDANYESVREHVEGRLPGELEPLRQFDRLMRRVGHEFCRAQPECPSCPLVELLPEGGPIEPEV